jgi:PmbA protein
MNILKQLQTQAEQVEVMHISSESTAVEYEANKLKTSKVEQTQGVAVRVVRKGRLGFAASSDEKATDKLIANALESASYGEEIPIQFPAPQPAAAVTTYDERIATFPIPRLVEIGQEILDLLLPLSPEARINITLDRGVTQFKLQNHAGVDISFQRSPLSFSTEVSIIQDNDILILFDMSGTTVWEDDGQQGYLAFARRLADKIEKSKKLTTIRSGHMPVIFSPSGSLVLGIPLMEGLDGKSVFTGISPLIGKVGEKLFDEKVTIVDDGTLSGKFGSSPYDDEGVAHRRNILVENGVLKSFYYDLKTAAQSGVPSTGNGSRGLFNQPNPALTNLLIEPGQASLAEMIAGIDEGLLIEDVIGMGQGNVISGAFSNPLSLAFKIEKGEIVGRVKNASIAGNVYDVLQNVAAVSRETQWVYNMFHAPYLLLPDMNVVAKE